MKTIKPLKLGVLCKVYERDGEMRFVVTVLAFFPFEAPGRLLPEMNLWKFAAAELGKDAMLDACMDKARGELLVTGHAHPPGGAARPATSVRVQLGSVDKTLWVVGDRQWRRGASTDPIPFTEMPVSYARAFGGEGYAPNPRGLGYGPDKTDTSEVHPLPNVEDPKHLVKSPRDRPPPAGLDAVDFLWPQRFSKVGTYDRAWLEERYPGFPADVDWTVWNAAPPDQWIQGFFRGDEAFAVEHMHPTKPRIEATLPRVVARCFVNQRTPDGEVFHEVKTHIDTVHLFPHAERGIVLFRGVVPVREDDAGDVLQMVLGFEAMGSPKPVEHYKTVLAQRLDLTKPLLHLRDSDLMPARAPGEAPLPDEKLSDMEDLLARERILEKNMRRGMEKQLERVRQRLRDEGIDPARHVPELLPPEPEAPGIEDLPEHVEALMAEVEELKADAEVKRKAAEEQARATCAENGVDYDKAVAEALEKSGGPPRFRASAVLAELKEARELGRNAGVPLPDVEAKLADPELSKKLYQVEAQLNDAYRITAHMQRPAAPANDARRRELREEVVMKAAAGVSLEHRDLTGADLSKLDLHGADLSGAFLEGADLSGADLRGANLTRAVLTRADLTGATFQGAVLKEANLGEAKLCGAHANDADLTGATLKKADLSGADLSGATLLSADMGEAVFAGADFSGAKASEMLLMKTSLSGIKLAGADLTKCKLLDVDLEGVDFSGARMTSAVLVGAKGKGAVFRGASLQNLRVVERSSFAGADFSGADLAGANLRGTNLAGADLTGAKLAGADLSACDLTDAKLAGVHAPECRFAKADLSRADLSKADLTQAILSNAKANGTLFDGANLFRADAARMRGDTATSFKGAHTRRVRVVAARGRDGQG